ncbi:FAD:protein FMN transferase [Anaerovorax odorimutans]|uniref:FAD:protein FMN transferase n=1 Tax=Anaerovorax odorimutans TaxID=109327 RepID=A0ABT1RMC4_9FIRM|nr:FAD:protein FMN transferase [Anaerovorax odorimutans]MCQ4636340.1 FAD:protein FMN transferase [Anaerovorax odorimutans]
MNALKKRRGRLSLLLAAVLILGAAVWFVKKEKTERYEAEFIDVFDTMTKIVGYSKSEKQFRDQTDFIHKELKRYHQLFDIYHDYTGVSNIKSINDHAGKAPVKVDEKILDLLEFSRQVYQMTNGNVNVAFGSVLSIWHEYRESGTDDPARAQLPPMEALREAAKHTNIEDLIIDRQKSTVFLKDPQMSLDVGAVAKGFAVEAVSRDVRREKQADALLLSVGGNVRAIGYKDGKSEPWKVGIQNPDDSGKMLRDLSIADSSLVTSGDYQRYYMVDGKRYNHIIDPKTLMPAQHYRAVTVHCQDSGLADALSTAAFLLDYEKSRSLIESIKGAGALYVMKDGSLRGTKEFE